MVLILAFLAAYNKISEWLLKLTNFRTLIVAIFSSLLTLLALLSIYVLLENNISIIKTSVPPDIVYIIAVLVFWTSIFREALSRRRSIIATVLSATCMPLQVNANEIKTVLIQNINFESKQWMFPGGHVFIEYGDFPHEVAVSRARDEAGITVQILDFSMGITSKHITCKQQKSPHFIFLFNLGKDAKCYKNSKHEQHLDLAYIAEISGEVENSSDGKYNRVVVPLDLSCNSINDIRQKMIACIQEKLTELKQEFPDVYFPEDMPERCLLAIKLYKKIKNIP